MGAGLGQMAGGTMIVGFRASRVSALCVENRPIPTPLVLAESVTLIGR